MGKGDARTKRGKTFRHSFGNSRPRVAGRNSGRPAVPQKATPKVPVRAPAATTTRSRSKRSS